MIASDPCRGLANVNSVVHELLAAGADISAVGNRGVAAIHWACMRGDVRLVRRLKEAGADLNLRCQNHTESTPLMLAAEDDQPGIVEYLLDEDVDIEAADSLNSTALDLAVANNAHRCMSLLLDRKAAYLRVNSKGETILHLAARGGDEETLDILSKRRLVGLDLGIRESAGKTAAEIHQDYGARDLTTREAFANLIRSIDSANKESQDSDDEAIFYDAHG
ncbi:ankyrin repeat-containing domain protein [Xylariales sp. AK1849]|nr:ankyrin repeat-containing domain protein [Xylariales sp. AK1849]